MKDMTEGVPFRIICSFSIPMLLSMAFQQLYNIADSVIAGKFVGVDALAAVGSSYPITMLFIAVATGSCAGCSVVISQLFGAGQLGRMKTAVSTSLISLLLLSVFCTVVGVVICDPVMRLIHTPESIFVESALYLRIYICGLFFLFLYNAATAIFTGLGDSRTPLYFLIFSSVLNIILDYLFVKNFHLGVAGVAWATFAAQGFSSLISIAYLAYKLRQMATKEKTARFSGSLLRRIITIAVPSILQQSFISVGQLCVQGLVNQNPAYVVAGYSAAFKVNTFAISCYNTMSNALSSFTAQNVGAGKLERVIRGYKGAVAITLGFAVLIIALMFFVGRDVLGIFVEKGSGQNVIDVGVQFMRTLAPFYLVICLKIVTDGVLRGAGAMRCFMVSTFSDLVIRVLFSYILVSFIGFQGICWAFPVGWVIGTALSLFYFWRGSWKRRALYETV